MPLFMKKYLNHVFLVLHVIINIWSFDYLYNTGQYHKLN